MSNIQIFQKQELGQVRVAGDKDNPLFCLRDVCNILGITQTKDVKASIIKEFGYDGDLIYPISDSLGRTQQATFITEPHLYFVLMRSDKPRAKPFRQWVVNDVLPQIRKTGSYNGFKAPANMVEALELALEQAKEIEALSNKIEQDRPKVTFANAVSGSDSSISIGQFAKILKQNGIETGRQRLFNYFREKGYLIKGRTKDFNMPTQKAMEQGLFEVQEKAVALKDKTILSLSPRVTTKGQKFFIELFADKQGV